MIRPGDIVRLAGDPPLHALVVANYRDVVIVDRRRVKLPKRGHLMVKPLNRHNEWRDVRTRDVVAHWRRAKAR